MGLPKVFDEIQVMAQGQANIGGGLYMRDCGKLDEYVHLTYCGAK